MNPFTQQTQSVHRRHELRSPHRQRLTADQAAELQLWLGETENGESRSIIEISNFVSHHPPMAAALTDALASVSVGLRLISPSVHHAVALLGTRRSITVLAQLAERAGSVPTKHF